MYTTGPMTTDAFLYSPAFAQAIWPAAQLPWPVFAVVGTFGLGAALAWLLAPLGRRWSIPLWLAGLPEITSGNVFILLALTAVLGFRRPDLWVFAALTKVTVCVGPVWFLVRQDWRRLAWSALAIAVVVAVSAFVSPALWTGWLHFLILHATDVSAPLGASVLPPAAVRIPLGLAFLIWAALKNKTWGIPVAMLVCAPVLWLGSLTLLAAIPRLAHSASS